MYTLVDKQNRGVLGEGRNKGLASAFCSHKDGVLTTIMPLSPCKDYLNDVISSEATGKKLLNYGLRTVKTGIFENADAAYLVISILGQGAKNPVKYDGMDKDIKALDANHKIIEKAINWFEEAFKVDGRTIISKISNNMYAVRVPLFWTAGTYLISLHGLLLRATLHWDGTGEPLDYLRNLENEEKYVLTPSIPKIEYIIKHGAPKQDLIALDSPHNIGIVNFPFPKEVKEKT